MKYLKSFEINEISKSENYLKITSTPYNGNEPTSISRFVEYTSENKNGWKLTSFQPVDEHSNPRGKELNLKQFSNKYPTADFNGIKLAITSALGEMGIQKWIEEFKFVANKKYACIYLGKLGIKFEDELFAPILEYPASGKKGDSFWLSASMGFDEVGHRIMVARTVLIHPDHISDSEIERASLSLLNNSRIKAWEDENERRRISNEIVSKIMPRHITEREFYPQLEIIRDNGERNFFICYIDGVSEKNIVSFAKRSVTGETEATLPVSTSSSKDNREAKRQHGKFFNLAPTDKSLRIFQYYNTDINNKNLPLNKYTFLEIQTFGKPTYTKNYREVSVRDIRTNKTFALKLKIGDKIKVPRLYDNKISYNEAEIILTPPESINSKRIAVKWLD